MNNTIAIKTLTPLHIGSGRDIQRNFEFVYLQTNQQVVLMDDLKVLNLIGEENLHNWVSVLDKGENLMDFIEKYSGQTVSAATIGKKTINFEGEFSGSMNQYREQVHSGNGQPMLPGSSIKGALRTILLNLYIDEDKDDGFYKNKFNLTNRKGKFSDATLIKRHLGEDANSDLLRLMRTGDAHFDQTICLLTKSINQYKAGEWEFKDTIQQYIECIPTAASTTFRYTFNDTLAQRAKEKRIKLHRRKGGRNDRHQDKGYLFAGKHTEDIELSSLFKFTNQHTADILRAELELWGKEKNYPVEIETYLEKLQELSNIVNELEEKKYHSTCILRIGWGTGFKNMTGDWQDGRFSDELYDKFINEVRHSKYNSFILPKTRRMTATGIPLGFVQLTQVS